MSARAAVRRHVCAGGAALLVLAAACAPAVQTVPVQSPPDATVVRPGAPGEPTRAEPAAPAAAGRAPHVAADAEFMRHMIAHHAQAIEMTSLVEERTTNAAIRTLAARIDASQVEEMSRMVTWLRSRGETAPDPAHAHHEHPGMPGMLTADEMAQLRAARGTAFDRLFLESMIRHHEGALAMVAELFAMPGAGREPELFRFATHVDTDQRIEIARMRNLLGTMDQ